MKCGNGNSDGDAALVVVCDQRMQGGVPGVGCSLVPPCSWRRKKSSSIFRLNLFVPDHRIHQALTLSHSP